MAWKRVLILALGPQWGSMLSGGPGRRHSASDRVGMHINALELRALLATVKWLVRERKVVGMQVCHMIDSLVCFSAVAKGRTSSRPLNLILRRLNSLLIATDISLTLAYVRSKDNPADGPSRWILRVRDDG